MLGGFLLGSQLIIHPWMTLTTFKGTLHMEKSTAHGDAEKYPNAPLVNNDNGTFQFAKGVQQKKGGDSSSLIFAKKELMVKELDDGECTEKQLSNTLEVRPPKDLADLKTEAFSGCIAFWKFKKLIEDGWLTKEDLAKMVNVREVMITNRGNVVQFLGGYKVRGLVNIKGLDLGDVRSAEAFDTWAASKFGKLSFLVKQNVSQRGTEYTCHQCGVTFGGRSLILHHLCVAHALWLEQVGYEGNSLSPNRCKHKFSRAVEVLCDPKLQIERVFLKDDVFCPTDSQPFKVSLPKCEQVAKPLKRKKPQRASQEMIPFKKRCQQVEKSPFYGMNHKTHAEGRSESACYRCGRLILALVFGFWTASLIILGMLGKFSKGSCQ